MHEGFKNNTSGEVSYSYFPSPTTVQSSPSLLSVGTNQTLMYT